MPATQIKKQDIISSKSANYLVLDFNGEGRYGKVATCVNLSTHKTIAIKIHKSLHGMNQGEVNMLKELRSLDPDKNNLVKFIEHFTFNDLSCIAFEMLDRSLWDLIGQRETPLSLNEIRPITHQLLVAFEALKGRGIIHTDLKPDNVMLVNHKDEPYRVKLIDFGLALPASQVRLGMSLQPVAYRAPEVTLGLPISEAIDMWGLGCVLAELYFGNDLFPGASTYQMMKVICHLLGQPADNLLAAGKNTWQYFSREQESPNQGWRLKTPEEFKEANGFQPKFSELYLQTVGSLDDHIRGYEAHDNVEYRDRMAFLDLLKQLLSLSAETRITPGQALKHSFLTMFHLEQDRDSSSYAKAAFHLMNICAFRESDEMESTGLALGRDPGLHKSRPILNARLESNRSPIVKEPYWNSSAKTSDSDIYKGGVSQAQCNDFQFPLHKSQFKKESYWNSGAESSPINNEDEHSTFQVQKNDILSSKSARYLVLDFNGEGCFGKVAKCVNLKTFETTAIKIHKECTDELVQREVDMLKQIRTLDSEKTNVVKFIDNFMFRGLSCIAFEMLDRSLWDLVEEINAPLSLNQIRPIIQQLLVAFKALKGIGFLHTDLKPDNVMLVNHEDEPFRVKLIDFGLAMPASEADLGMIMRPVAYRPPEVNLGLPITEAIDMWGLGCVMTFLYFGNNIFPATSSNDVMNAVCQLLGQPADHLLSAGKYTYDYFTWVRDSTNPGWRLKYPIEGLFGTIKNMDELVKMYMEKENDVVVNEDTTAFLDLLKGLLDPNFDTRITPEKALQHPFITMDHLAEKMKTSPYVKAAFELMTVCPLDDLDEILDSETDIKSTCPAIGGETVGQSLDEKDDIELTGLPIRDSQELQMSPVKGALGAHAMVYSSGEILAEIANLEDTNPSYGVTDQPFYYSDYRGEMVDMSLSALLWQRQEPMSLIAIRRITHHLLRALKTLKGRGIVHTDINPDNIMFVNPQNEPFRIKLINSGKALPASKVEVGMALQQCAYRAPEVNLALPISEAIDMWGLGCVIAYMYFGFDLFPGETSYDMMKAVCILVGQPEDHLLNAGKNTCVYFNRAQGSTNPGWQLKTPEEYAEATGEQPKVSEDFYSATDLDDAIGGNSQGSDSAEFEDRMAFKHLLKWLLDPNPQTRITPSEALRHHFFTLTHLEDYKNSPYAVTAKSEMQLSRLDDPNVLEEFLLPDV